MKTCEVDKKELALLQRLEDAYGEMPEDATEFELLEMIAKVVGEPTEVIHQRYMQIQAKKKRKKN